MITKTLAYKLYDTSGFDLYGKPLITLAGSGKLAVVRLERRSEQSTVRADASESRGYANEQTEDALFLMDSRSAPKVDMKIEVLGRELKIVRSEPKFCVFGKLDHYEVGCVVWGS